MKKALPYIAIALLLSYIIYFDGCNVPEVITNTVTTSDTIYNHTTDTVTIVKWKVKKIIQPQDTFFVEFDSTQLLAIARKFYSINFFDTTINVSECEISFNTLVSQNNPYNSLFSVKNNRATIINNTTNTTIVKAPPKFYGGLQIQSNLNTSNVFGMVGWQNGKMLYMGGISLFKVEDNRMYEIGVLYGL